jgi:DNA-directed RNA polymerase
VPAETRRDIYTEVAAVVSRMVTEDAGAGDELAKLWLGRVNRKTVKRAVMTTPYGVTEQGIGRQLLVSCTHFMRSSSDSLSTPSCPQQFAALT